MKADLTPSDEKLLGEIEAFFESPQAISPRSQKIERKLPISFAALLAGRDRSASRLRRLALLATLGSAAAAVVFLFATRPNEKGSERTVEAEHIPALEDPVIIPPAPEPIVPATLQITPEEKTPPVIGIPPMLARIEPSPDGSPPMAPTERVTRPVVSKPADDLWSRKADEPLWSLRQRTRPEPPAVANNTWPVNAIDRFVLEKIESAGLVPAPMAPAAARLRRLYYDLTGLPPTADEIRKFLSKPSRAAYVETVDELLERWQFGEKWARHWLDLAAYDAGVDHAWRYREYVIAAFNKDKPFNWFLAEQIAGDLLHHEDPLRRAEAQVATAFLAMGEVDLDEEKVEKQRMDQIDGQIDLVTRTFLGLSVACARCHDHKFDPIRQSDYYALAGIFDSSDTRGGIEIRERTPRELESAKKHRNYLVHLDIARLQPRIGMTDQILYKDEIKRLQARANSYAGRISRTKDARRAVRLQTAYRELITRLRKLQNHDPQTASLSGTRAIGLVDGRDPADCAVRIDGEAEQIGDVVPRGFPEAISFSGDAVSIPYESSGRLELARWLLAENHPLTARVFVNRVWAQLFGRGIVRSVDEFGTNGGKPTHPELLDHLANEFIANKWSVKRLIREIVVSRSYQLDSVASELLVRSDPNNSLFARREIRPLTAEELRDSMIAAAGLLSSKSAATRDAQRYLASGEFGAYSAFVDGDEFPLSSPFRTIYLPVVDKAPGMLALFDAPEPGDRTAERARTTGSTQAMFLMNNEFIYQAAMEAAFIIEESKQTQPLSIVPDIFLSLLGRPPSNEEISKAVEFVREFSVDKDVTNPGIAEVSNPLGKRILQIVGVDFSSPRAKAGVAMHKLNRIIPWTMLQHAIMQTAEYRFLR